MTKTIEITISPKGETTVTTKGFAGASCREASKFIEDTLGQRIAENLTAEFYHSQAAEQRQQQRG